MLTLEESNRTAENVVVLLHSINNQDNIYDESTEDFRDQRLIAPDNEKVLKLTLRNGDVLFEKLVAVFGSNLGLRAKCLMKDGYFGNGFRRFTIKVGGYQQWTLCASFDMKDKERYLTIEIEDRSVSNLTKSTSGKYESFNRFD